MGLDDHQGPVMITANQRPGQGQGQGQLNQRSTRRGGGGSGQASGAGEGRPMQGQQQQQHNGPPHMPPYGFPGQLPPGAQPLVPPPLLLDAASSRLLVPSRAALTALLALPLALWALAVAAGTLHAEPLPEGPARREFEHPLIWFDRHVFRVWGPLLPLVPYLVRMAAAKLLRPSPAARGGRVRLVPGLTLPLHAIALYGIIIAVRIVLYVSHVAVQRRGNLPLLSDHLLLAASVVACFQSELAMCWSDIIKMVHLADSELRLHAVVASMVASVLALVFVYGDMYCTARWYHEPGESLAALAVGAALFNLPVLAWLERKARRLPALQAGR